MNMVFESEFFVGEMFTVPPGMDEPGGWARFVFAYIVLLFVLLLNKRRTAAIVVPQFAVFALPVVVQMAVWMLGVREFGGVWIPSLLTLIAINGLLGVLFLSVARPKLLAWVLKREQKQPTFSVKSEWQLVCFFLLHLIGFGILFCVCVAFSGNALVGAVTVCVAFLALLAWAFGWRAVVYALLCATFFVAVSLTFWVFLKPMMPWPRDEYFGNLLLSALYVLYGASAYGTFFCDALTMEHD